MIRVLKTDLFRLFRSKAFYAFPITLVIFFTLEMMFSAVINEVESGQTADTEISQIETETAQTGPDSGVTAEITVSVDTQAGSDTAKNKNYTGFGIKDLFGSLTDGLLLLFLGITAVIFATCETRNGFVKTAAGCISDRGFMPLSKIAAGIVTLAVYIVEFAVIRFAFTALTALLSGKPLKFVPLPEGDVGKYTIYILICILVHIAMIALMSLLHELTHNRAAGIVTIFIVSMGLIGQILMALMDVFKSMTGLLKDFDISKYLMINNITEGYNAPQFHASITFVISLIYLIGGTLLSVWLAKRKDIR